MMVVDENMSFFKNKDLPSCSNCEYADKYIPYYNKQYSDPYCSKGHGKCDIDKICEDYKMISICGRCDSIRIKKDKSGLTCIKKGINVSFSGKTCDDFVYRDDLMKRGD